MKNTPLDSKRVEALLAFFKKLDKEQKITSAGNYKTYYKPVCDGQVVSVNVDDKYIADYRVLTPFEVRNSCLDVSQFDRFDYKLKRWYIKFI